MNSGSDISKEDIIEYQRYLKGYLLDKVPEADLVEGSFLNDVVVKSMAYVVALFDREASSIKSRLSIENLEDLEDLTAVQALDNLASNFFISRNEGQFATGIVRVVLSSNERAAVITPLTRFTKSDGIHFMYAGGVDGETSLVVANTDLIEIFNSSGQPTGTWYFDVPVIGEAEFLGSSLNPGIFRAVNPSIPNLIRVENVDPFTPADELEPNIDFAERIKSSITHRGLSSAIGIKTYLLDSIPSLKKVEVISSTSPLLSRDILSSGTGLTNFKTLGKCNIYSSLGVAKLDKTIARSAGSLPAAINSLITLEVPRTEIKNLLAVSLSSDFTRIDKIFNSLGEHIVTLKNNVLVGDSDGTHVEPGTHVEFTYLDVEDTSVPNSRGEFFSRTNKERLAVKINETSADVALPLTCLVSVGSELVEAEIYSEDNRVPSIDSLSYCFNVKNLILDIKYFKTSTENTLPGDALKADLSRYVNDFCEQNTNISLGDIFSYILEEYSPYVSGIDFSDTSSRMSMFLPNGVTVFFTVGSNTSMGSVEAYYELPETGIKIKNYLPSDYLTSLQVGDSTSIVRLLPENITFTEVSV